MSVDVKKFACRFCLLRPLLQNDVKDVVIVIRIRADTGYPLYGVLNHLLLCCTSMPEMAIKSDSWIRRLAQEAEMIEPFVAGQVREGVISYGLSSYGYDIRVSNEFKIFTNVHSAVVDPKHFDPKSWMSRVDSFYV